MDQPLAPNEPLMFAAHQQDPHLHCIRSAFLPGEIKIVEPNDTAVGTGRIAIFTAPEALGSATKRQEVEPTKLRATLAEWAIPTHRRFAISGTLSESDFRAEVASLRQELMRQKEQKKRGSGGW